MKTVLVCNQKGGVGKTLISNELVWALERDKVPYNFYDLDGQDSSAKFLVEDPDAAVQILDTPGAITPELKKCIEIADFIIVPTMLTALDMKPLVRTLDILSPYLDKKPLLVVFNKWNRFNAAKDFIAWFNKKYPNIKTAILTDTTLFHQSYAYGLSIYEVNPTHTGCKQIEYIYSTIKYELNIKDEHTASDEERSA